MARLRRIGSDSIFATIPNLDFQINGLVIDALIKSTLGEIKDKLTDTLSFIIPYDEGELSARGVGEFGPTKIAPNRWRAGVGLRKEPAHGIWVHDGTGIYGPRKSPIVPKPPNKYLVFQIEDREFRLRSVKGQKPQPFMDEAYYIVNRTYVPAKVESLRLKIQALLKTT